MNVLVGRAVWNIKPLFNKLPPTTKRALRCCACGCDVLYFKDLIVHKLGDEHRLDIYVKCRDCGHIMIFGVHITGEEYEKLLRLYNRHVDWRYFYSLYHRHFNVNSV